MKNIYLFITYMVMAQSSYGNIVEPIDTTIQKEIVVDRFESKEESNLYVGVGIGLSKVEGSITSTTNTSFILGYFINEFSSAELRYLSLISNPKNETNNQSLELFSFFIKQSIPLDLLITPYVLIGYGNVKYSNVNEASLQYGVGLEYAQSKKVNIFIDYINYFNGTINDTENSDITALNLGAIYNF